MSKMIFKKLRNIRELNTSDCHTESREEGYQRFILCVDLEVGIRSYPEHAEQDIGFGEWFKRMSQPK